MSATTLGLGIKQQDKRHKVSFSGIASPEVDLFPSNLRELQENLLYKPEKVEYTSDARFEIYKAKDLYTSNWKDPVLTRMLVEARKTYKEYYGEELPLIDKYDSKSAVYFVQADYQLGKEQIPVREWSSLRFVPIAGNPYSNEDFDFVVYRDSNGKKKPIMSAVQDRLGLSKQEAEETIMTHSRICAIRPVALYAKDQDKLNKYWENNGRIQGNKHSALSFALMNKQFFEDYCDSNESNINIRYFTSQMHSKLTDNILSYPPFTGETILPFTPAYDTLNLPHPSSVFINRNSKKVYAYDYPAYFLNLEIMQKTLKDLISRDVLSRDIVEQYLPEEVTYEQAIIEKKPKMKYFRRLGNLLTIKGKIKGARITGEELRAIFDISVPDGPVWRLMEVENWKKGTKLMIEKAKQTDKEVPKRTKINKPSAHQIIRQYVN